MDLFIPLVTAQNSTPFHMIAPQFESSGKVLDTQVIPSADVAAFDIPPPSAPIAQNTDPFQAIDCQKLVVGITWAFQVIPFIDVAAFVPSALSKMQNTVPFHAIDDQSALDGNV